MESEEVCQKNKQRDENGQRLIRAAKTADFEECKRLLPLCDANAMDPNDGNTALMLSAYVGMASLAELLLPHSDPNAANRCGVTALMVAAIFGRVEIAQMLLAPSDANLADEDGRTALMHAARHDGVEIVSLLLPVSNADAVDRWGMSAEANARFKGMSNAAGLIESHQSAQAIDKAVGRAGAGNWPERSRPKPL